MSNLTFNFSGESKSPTKFVGNSRHFQITIDEPESLGGKDEAANPVEYTLASLAGCLNVVAHIVAKELDFEITSLKIHISGNLNPQKFLGDSNENRAGFTDISVVLDLQSSDTTPETLKKWRDIVEDRCPVTDNLANKTDVKIKLSESESCPVKL